MLVEIAKRYPIHLKNCSHENKSKNEEIKPGKEEEVKKSSSDIETETRCVIFTSEVKRILNQRDSRTSIFRERSSSYQGNSLTLFSEGKGNANANTLTHIEVIIDQLHEKFKQACNDSDVTHKIIISH